MVRQLLLVASAALVAFSAAEQEVLAATSESRLVSSSVETEAGHSHGLRAKQHVSEDVDKLWVTAFGGTPASGGVLATLTGGIFTDPLLVSGHVSLSKKRFDDPSALNDPMYGFAGSSGGAAFKTWHALKFGTDNLGFLKQGGALDGVVQNDRATFNAAKSDARGYIICSSEVTCKGGKCWDKAVGEFNLGAGEFGKDYAFRPFAAGSADEANYNIGHPPPRILRFLKPFNYLGECRGKWLEKLEDGTGKCMNCAVYPASIGVDTVSMCNDLVGEDAIFKCKGDLKAWLPVFKNQKSTVCECWKAGQKVDMKDCPSQQRDRFPTL